jgi:hypothetical protein
MAAQNVSGSVTIQASFSEAITAGVITPQSLPASISQNLSYQYSSATGNPLTTDAIVAKTLAFSAAGYATINLWPAVDLAGNSTSFQRVREIIIQNSNSFGCFINAGSSNASTSGVMWLASAANLQLPGYAANTNSGASSSTMSVVSNYSTYWPAFRLCDPVTTNISTTTSSALSAGLLVTSLSNCLVVYAPAAATSNSINYMIAGCTQY